MEQSPSSRPRVLPTVIVALVGLAAMVWGVARLYYYHTTVFPAVLRQSGSAASESVATTALGVVVAPLGAFTVLAACYAGWFIRRHDDHLRLRAFLRSWPLVFLLALAAWGLPLFVALMFERELLGSFEQLAPHSSAIEGSLLLLAVVPLPLAVAMWYRYLRD